MCLDNHVKLKNALEHFGVEYCSNPFLNLYEVDVQVQLAKILEKHFYKKHVIKRELSINTSINESNIEFNIGKVHREYPQDILFDVVILGEPKQLHEIPIDINKIEYEAFYHQPIKYAIELKFIPLYSPTGVINVGKSVEDYERLIKKVEGKEFIFKDELKYAIQLTLFQSKEEQYAFLKYHDSNTRRKYKDWYKNDFPNKIKEKEKKIGYYFLDIEDETIKPVYPLSRDTTTRV